MPSTRPIAVDLFAGAGGMSLGFEQAGFDVAAAVELDPIHCATHEFNFPTSGIVCNGVDQTDAGDVLDAIPHPDPDIAVVFGGPPCQGFSMIGKRSLDDPRNALVFHFLRLVVELQASYFVMENVSGLTLGKHRRFLSELIEEFERQGYDVLKPYKVLDAAHYGVPQRRRRLFLVGCRKGQLLPTYPPPTCIPADAVEDQVADLFGLPKGPTVWDALSDLPEADSLEALLEDDSIRVDFGTPSDYAAVLRGLKTDSEDYSIGRIHDPNVLTASLRTVHTAKSRSRFESTAHGDAEPVSRFRKLDPDGLCNTLRAGTASNRGAFTSPRPIHPYTPRCITVREAARLHSYPDWFRFHATKWHGFRQVGNSVPPLLARSVAASVMDVIGTPPSVSESALELGDESLLHLTMTQAAARYGVDPHVIAPRTRAVAQP